MKKFLSICKALRNSNDLTKDKVEYYLDFFIISNPVIHYPIV